MCAWQSRQNDEMHSTYEQGRRTTQDRRRAGTGREGRNLDQRCEPQYAELTAEPVTPATWESKTASATCACKHLRVRACTRSHRIERINKFPVRLAYVTQAFAGERARCTSPACVRACLPWCLSVCVFVLAKHCEVSQPQPRSACGMI